jgi:hypothetical protein
VDKKQCKNCTYFCFLGDEQKASTAYCSYPEDLTGYPEYILCLESRKQGPCGLDAVLFKDRYVHP